MAKKETEAAATKPAAKKTPAAAKAPKAASAAKEKAAPAAKAAPAEKAAAAPKAAPAAKSTHAEKAVAAPAAKAAAAKTTAKVAVSNTANLKKVYLEQIIPTLTKEFSYTSKMQVPVLQKIVINQGLGAAVADKKIVDVALTELTAITGQKAVATVSKKDISNFKLRRKMPIGAMVTLRREQMYEFLERLVRVALPRIRDFRGVESKLDGKGNYTLGITEQIIFPEINIDEINKILGMNITFVTSAKTDEEGYALLREFGLPFKNAKKEIKNG
ncbi:50S ribosomal protein L5 [Candidatus Symbiothrix dinenymphae]|nr:50S ribosomal protein L5 [Candidatus Symbiothrix dinenymphae]